MDLLKVIVRALLSLVTLFLVAKMIGKKQVSQLSLFDYVIGISIGNFAAEMIINLDSNFLYGTVAVLVFGIMAYLINFLTMKSIVLRRYFMGIPTVLIDNGQLLEESMRKIKVDVNDLLEQCRTLGYFNLDDIAYAIMEANGEISILPKHKAQTVTKEDLNIEEKKVRLVANVIIDGNVMHGNLKNFGKSNDWLYKELKKKKKDVKDILLATLDVDNKLIIYPKNDKVSADVLE